MANEVITFPFPIGTPIEHVRTQVRGVVTGLHVDARHNTQVNMEYMDANGAIFDRWCNTEDVKAAE